MKTRDLAKLRRLDPKLAAKLEGVLEAKGAPEPEVASAPVLRSDDEAATLEQPASSPTPPSQLGEEPAVRAVQALVARLVEEQPDCKRTAEELSLSAWRTKSNRREGEAFALPPEFDVELRAMSDSELGIAWGWVTKHRYRGLSARDEAVQREVYARSLSIADLYGLARQPAVSAMLEETLRGQGCRSAIALYVCALLELMIAKGRLAVRISAAEAHVLKGCAASSWWAAIRKLQEMGILIRVRSSKPGAHGVPVQRCTNLYQLGPWWFAGALNTGGDPIPGTTPLELVVGLLGLVQRQKPSAAATAATERGLRGRRARRRSRNQASRDRNRRRYAALPPKVVTTREVERVVNGLARERQMQLEAAAASETRQRAQALLQGELAGVRVGEAGAAPEPLFEDTAPLEAAAVNQVARLNRGLAEGMELRREVARRRGIRSLPSSHRSDIVNCRPESSRQSRRGKLSEKNSIAPPLSERSITKTPLPQTSHERPPPPDPHTPTKAGDKWGTSTVATRTDARALDEIARSAQRSDRLVDTAIREAFAAMFGHDMPPNPALVEHKPSRPRGEMSEADRDEAVSRP